MAKMRKYLTLLFSIAISLLTVSLNAENSLAVSPVIHKSPAPLWILQRKPYDKKPVARNIQNGAYDELVEEQINVDLQATYNHIITDIVSESGVQNNSEISVSFDPSYERVDFHEIIIWRNSKSQNRLNVDAFKMLPDETEFDKFIYNGTYSAKYILADIRKGDRIEYSYTVTGRNPIFNGKFCRNVYLQGSDPIMHQYTTLLVSDTRQLNSKSFNLRSAPRISVKGGTKRYEWEDFEVPGVSTNKFEPKWFNQYSRVQFSDYNTWADVIDWGIKINPLQTSFSGELADTIAMLKKRYGVDQKKYFRAAVTLVQDEIRYMGIETGPYSHKANTPEKVFKQRYGDCKDKSLLLASILNAGGIEAHLALLNTDLEDKITDFIPSATLFDHAVVVANINGKPVWVDATISNQGGKGVDIYFPPYGKALILKSGNNGLTSIEQSKTGKATVLEKFHILDEVSPVKFTVTTTYTLDRADDIRDELAQTGTTQTEKNYLEFYSKTYNKIEAADSIKIKDDKEKNELTTIESYTISNFFKRDSVNKKYNASFYVDDISNQLPDIDGQVKSPVSVNYPYNIDYTIQVTVTNGWDMNNEHDAINRDAYQFVSDKKVSDNELTLRYQFKYLKDFIPQSQLSNFKSDIKDLKDDKLYFSFSYTPDIKKIPFRINYLMIIITLLITCGFTYFGLRIYKTETKDSPHFDSRNSFPPALGGWLILLVIVLFATVLGILINLINEGYYSFGKWDQVTTGLGSIMHKAQLVFEVIGYVCIICFSVFCLVLILNKRDISPRFIKLNYLFIVVYLFSDYFFNAFVNQEFSNYNIQQIIKAVIVAALWTYYLNTSDRVKQTFVVPYPN
jgi:hypothetical protein